MSLDQTSTRSDVQDIHGNDSASRILSEQHNSSFSGTDHRATSAADSAAMVSSSTLPNLQIDGHDSGDSSSHENGFSHWLHNAETVASDLGAGAWNEITHHPDQVLEAAAVGLAAGVAVTAAAVLIGPEVLFGAAVVGAAGALYGAYQIGAHAAGWTHDADVVTNAQDYSASDVAEAHTDLQNVGATGTVIGAGVIGALAAGPVASAASDVIGSLTSGSVSADEASASSILNDAVSSGRTATSAPIAAADAPVPVAATDVSSSATSAVADSTSSVVASDASSVGSDAASADTTLASTAAKPLGEGLGTVNADGVRVLDAPQTEQLYATASNTNGELQFAKPDLPPGAPKYYQAEAQQVSLSEYPEGLRVGTTESPLNAANDITLANGDTIPQGKLPTGVQISGDTIHTPPEGVRLANGTMLTDGMKLPDGTNLTGGQNVSNSDWVITRSTTVDGKPAYDVTTPHDDAFQARWKPVPGQPGQFSPRSVPTNMTYLPAGKYQIPTSWGTASGEGPAFLAQYGPGDYNIITLKDAVETGYIANPTNDASRAFVANLPDTVK